MANPGGRTAFVIAIADTSPLHYLILIDGVHLLPDLFESVVAPPAVRRELTHPRAPVAVRAWMASPPWWLTVQVPRTVLADRPARLGPGEHEALALAAEHPGAVLLLDDRLARRYAQQRQWPMFGTLGLLDLLARRHPERLSFDAAVARLQRTSFRADHALLAAVRRRPR